MKLLYYYYYLFYTKILPDDEPHATTIFTLSLCVTFLVNGMIDFYAGIFYHMNLDISIYLSILLLIMGVNYFIFIKKGAGKKIIIMKPKIFNSNLLSIIICTLFFLLSLSIQVLLPIYLKQFITSM